MLAMPYNVALGLRHNTPRHYEVPPIIYPALIAHITLYHIAPLTSGNIHLLHPVTVQFSS